MTREAARRRYDREAESYLPHDPAYAPILERLTGRARDLARAAGDAWFLDVGAANGTFISRALAAETRRYVGIDLSVEMLRVFRRASPSVRLVACDAERLPFRRAPILGGAIVLATIQMLSHDRVVGGVAARLRPGGSLLVEFHNRVHPATWYWRRWERRTHGLPLQATSLGRLRRLAERNGLRLAEAEGRGLLDPFFLLPWRRIGLSMEPLRAACLRPRRPDGRSIDLLLSNLPVLRDLAAVWTVRLEKR
jgi:SAM-dependent methyltransferase